METNMEKLRELEYPQLLGKTYLDHAGTTVCQRISLQSQMLTGLV
jgi:hypothetical protein